MFTVKFFHGGEEKIYRSGLDILAEVAELESKRLEKEKQGSFKKPDPLVAVDARLVDQATPCGVSKIGGVDGQGFFFFYGRRVVTRPRTSSQKVIRRPHIDDRCLQSPICGEESDDHQVDKTEMDRLLQEKASKKPLRIKFTMNLGKKRCFAAMSGEDEVNGPLKKAKETALKKPLRIKFTMNLGKKRCFAAMSGEDEVNGPLKKAKEEAALRMVDASSPEPDIPEVIKSVNKEREESVSPSDVTLVIEKPLTPTDVDKGQCRMSIPLTKAHNSDHFLTEEEKEILNRHDGKNWESIQVNLIEPSSAVRHVRIKNCFMSKNRMLVLVDPWNQVVKENSLKAGDVVQLWSFRQAQQLSLALIVLRRGAGDA
ncbi:hypothetical protein Tsubulata_032226 [Turnera subulata]|uniref:TF-B3 domain-containing protein n=1 Tax=Turnera subulata TaxID=218843 RepID=A0A9Q0GGP2_9ROSI|nr:hypothetical protein Tsubulata_032226 [Turnera subulata]